MKANWKLILASAVTSAAVAWYASRLATQDCNSVQTADGEFVTVGGRFSLVILSDQVMSQVFGPQWDQQSLFYRSFVAADDSGKLGTVDGVLYPMPRGAAIIVFGDLASVPIPCLVYSLETRRQATLQIDLVRGRVTMTGEASRRTGEPMLTPQGRLVFH